MACLSSGNDRWTDPENGIDDRRHLRHRRGDARAFLEPGWRVVVKEPREEALHPLAGAFDSACIFGTRNEVARNAAHDAL